MIRSFLSRLRTKLDHPDPHRRYDFHHAPPLWFDAPGALSQVDRLSRVTEAERCAIRQFVADGYVVLDDLYPMADIDAAAAEMAGLFDRPDPIPGLTLLNMREGDTEETSHITHADLLARPPDLRAAMRHLSFWRIHGFHLHSAVMRRLFDNPKAKRMCDLIFQAASVPSYAINFMYGSSQNAHQDMAVFHIYPGNALIGCWIALEDIDETSGPLAYYPGSHREPLPPIFPNYPLDNLRTCDPDTYRRYQPHVDDRAIRYHERRFLARKGQALLWHGLLYHGGAPVIDRHRTRMSMVVHYIVEGRDHSRHITGPTNW